MSSIINDIIIGRKTFFITPDKSLFPESFLEDYLALGYECYFIEPEISVPLSIKIDVILSVFKDSIIFFNIDAPIFNDNWPSLVSRYQKKYPEGKFGVMYAKRQTTIEKEELERLYLMDIGIQCGCIQLEYKKRNNFTLIERALYANQAKGRRQNVRACCNGFCSLQFKDDNDQIVKCKFNDISLSHFTISIKKDNPLVIEEYEKIENIQFFVKGLHFSTDAVHFTTRQDLDYTMYVFAFSKENGQLGLDTLNKQLLIPKLYKILEENCLTLLTRLFQTVIQRKKSK